MPATPGAKPGLPRILLGILLIAATWILFSMGFVAAFVDEFPAFRGSPVGHFLGGALFFGLSGLCLLTGLLCFRRRRTPAQFAESSRGWKALAALFLLLALVPVAVGTARLLTIGTSVDQWFAMRQLHVLDQFLAGGGHLAVGFLLFLPGLFFVALGRREGGAGHVIRGTVGWTLAAALVFLLALFSQKIIHGGSLNPGSPNGRMFAIDSVATPLWAGLFVFVGGVVVGVIVLAWPGRRAQKAEGAFVLEDDEEVDLAESPATSENTV